MLIFSDHELYRIQQIENVVDYEQTK